MDLWRNGWAPAAVCRKSSIDPALLQAHTAGGWGLARINGQRNARGAEARFLNFLRSLRAGPQKSLQIRRRATPDAGDMSQS